MANKEKYKKKLNLLKLSLLSNKKILENYFFLTILQIINSFFYIIIYPYLIRTLGMEEYGLYVYATAVSSFFLFLINFGFDLPSTKVVAENTENKVVLSNILSTIFTIKTLLFALSAILLLALILVIPLFKANSVIFLICFAANYSFILFPAWYFQGMQDLKTITYIQFLFKLISLPLIFFLVNTSHDLIYFTLITSSITIISSLIAYFIIRYKHDLYVVFIKPKEWGITFSEAKPFFFSTSASYLKENSIPIIIGTYFGTAEVAIYDLANKLVRVPRTLFMSINTAIFPKIIVNLNKHVIKKIIIAEFLLSSLVVIFMILFGKYLILLFGGYEMLDSYYMLILVSVTIISWLTVGAFINFIFIPSRNTYLITKNQITATLLFFITAFVGLEFIFTSIYMVGIAISISSISEIVYCFYVTRKYNLLKKIS